jgi:hypothetical protein
MKKNRKEILKSIQKDRPGEYNEFLQTNRELRLIKLYRWAYPTSVFLFLVGMVFAELPYWMSVLLAVPAIAFGIKQNKKWDRRKKVLEMALLLLEITFHTKEPSDDPDLINELRDLFADEN